MQTIIRCGVCLREDVKTDPDFCPSCHDHKTIEKLEPWDLFKSEMGCRLYHYPTGRYGTLVDYWEIVHEYFCPVIRWDDEPEKKDKYDGGGLYMVVF